MSVVVGYIPTKEGLAALRHAVKESTLRGCGLVVVNSSRQGREVRAQDAQQFADAVAEARRELGERGIDVEERALARGHEPAEDLIDVAQQTNAQCIVIGLRRRSPIGKLVLGSNAQRILLEATCPVIAVKSTT